LRGPNHAARGSRRATRAKIERCLGRMGLSRFRRGNGGRLGRGRGRAVAVNRETVEESSATSQSRWTARSSSAWIRLRAWRSTIWDRNGVK
jgi:hypothetical protein